MVIESTFDYGSEAKYECWIVHFMNGLLLQTNQRYYPDLGSDTSSVWNFCACSSTSFREKTKGGVTKCRLFFHATVIWF